MTQILLHRSDMGIVIATDSRGVSFMRRKKTLPDFWKCRKLFPLSPHAIAVTGGAGYGLLLCQSFQKYVRESGLEEYEDVVDCALPFFLAQIERVRRSHSSSERPELDRLYILLAGCMPQGSANPFRFVLLASEGPSDPLREVPADNVVAIPRQIGIEHRLNHLTPRKTCWRRWKLFLEPSSPGWLHPMMKWSSFSFRSAHLQGDRIEIDRNLNVSDPS